MVLRYSFRQKLPSNDFWKSYFTSSKYVQQLRDEHGEPDVIQIRKTFNNADSARLWEHQDKGICIVITDGTSTKFWDKSTVGIIKLDSSYLTSTISSRTSLRSHLINLSI
jgi:hypothetical protein